MAESHSARMAKFKIGDVVRHRIYPFRGVVYDVDPVFNNTEEWLTSIPEEILLPDETGKPCRHPMVPEMFEGPVEGAYRLRSIKPN